MQAGWEEYIGDFEAQLVKIANFTATNAPKVEDGDYSSMGSPQVSFAASRARLVPLCLFSRSLDYDFSLSHLSTLSPSPPDDRTHL